MAGDKTLPEGEETRPLDLIKENAAGLIPAFINHEFLKENKPFILKAAQCNGEVLAYLISQNLELKNDPEIVLAAVKQNGLVLEQVKLHLSNENTINLLTPEVVKAAVTQNPLALKYAGQFTSDTDCARLAVEGNGLALQFANTSLKNNSDLVQKAIRQNPMALRYASESLRDDFDFVRLALEGDGLALQYASESLRNNFDCVLLAVEENPFALTHASVALQNNFKLALHAAIKNPDVLNNEMKESTLIRFALANKEMIQIAIKYPAFSLATAVAAVTSVLTAYTALFFEQDASQSTIIVTGVAAGVGTFFHLRAINEAEEADSPALQLGQN
jgi:hypothetical protein